MSAANRYSTELSMRGYSTKGKPRLGEVSSPPSMSFPTEIPSERQAAGGKKDCGEYSASGGCAPGYRPYLNVASVGLLVSLLISTAVTALAGSFTSALGLAEGIVAAIIAVAKLPGPAGIDEIEVERFTA
jgi:hypothetical protein